MNLPVLFGATPIGAGDGRVESLTSFFTRLCHSRFLPPPLVLRRFVLEHVPSGIFPSSPGAFSTFLATRAVMFDLHSTRSISFAVALERLTGLEGLRAFTFASCADLFRAHTHAPCGVRCRRWCPSCFVEWSRASAPVIDPLLWRFPFIERCPVHRIPLVERCPECRRRQPILTQRVPMGYCVRCGGLLTAGLSSVSEDFAALGPEAQWAVARAAAMARLLARSSMLGAPPCPDAALACFGALLRRALESPPHLPQLSSCALARSLGIQPRFLPPLLCGEARPSLQFFLDACLQVAVEPADVVFAPSNVPAALESLGRVRLPDDLDLWTLACDAREEVLAAA